MQNRQNFDPNGIIDNYNSMIFTDNTELSVQNVNVHGELLINDQDLEVSDRNGMFSNPIDLLAAQSFYTVSRGSLQIVPQQGSIEINTKNQQEIPSTLKTPQNSLIFQEEENQEENELKLITQTEELTLRSSETEIREDIFNEYSPKKHRPLLKNHKPKTHLIKHTKQLIRELKRQYKYNDKIIGDVVLAVDNKIIKAKAARLEPIVSDKGHLSGLIIRNGDLELKVKVVNKKSQQFDPIMELWDENLQEWTQFSFKVKLRNA